MLTREESGRTLPGERSSRCSPDVIRITEDRRAQVPLGRRGGSLKETHAHRLSQSRRVLACL
jgi:hypothetical protein